MGYIEKTLLPGEEVKYKTGISWVSAFGTPGGAFVVALTLYWMKASQLGNSFLLIALLSLPFAWLTYKTSIFAVTNKRVLIKTGFLGRRSLELFLTKLEAISLDQGVLDRANDLGRIVIVGTGGTREVFKDIDKPMEFRKQVQIQVDALQCSKNSAA